ncbi:hypothetical protein CFK37_02420 [Virgibacillus phasianinus]|uniref:DUF58 domain-containing protein n=1 Tax=Virgibacillus phasianinus TaxID=2017483 RepID=A0A220TZ75_9BACI|nr:DUF58 domain-containing protein [Virgibacillus phasianinus]ASK61127.1 hypothetical protein CFK37_02420 [Virgibacillus phasianinus]
MYWSRSSDKAGHEYDLLPFLLVVLTITSIVISEPFILIIVGFIVVFMILIQLYNRQIGKKLILENKRRSIRMFEGEEAEFDLVLKNQSILPIFNGFVSFTTDEKVGSERFVRFNQKRKNHFHVPLLLMGKSEARIPISLIARERGVVHIKNIRFSFPHILNFEQVILSYQGLYQTEILVYPKLSPVAGIDDFPYNNFGNQVTQFSPFEDLLSPVGTRDYVPSDPFHRIHWKASAKGQTLQTKVFERNRNISWTIIVNIAESSPLGNVYLSPMMEKYIAQAAYICQTITKQGHPIELYVNAAKVGSMPFQLGSEGGREHLKKAFELLTRIEKDCNVMSMTNLLYRVDHEINDSNIVIIIGDVQRDSLHYTNKWNRRGNSVLHVSEYISGARLTEIKNEGLAVNDTK